MEISEFLGMLSQSEQRALLAHSDEVRTLLSQLAIIDGAEFELPLDLSDEFAVRQLFYDGAFRGTVDEKQIFCLPIPAVESCVRNVRYRIISGEQLKRSDGNVYRLDVDSWFKANHMHPADLAEALLPSARFHLLGRGGSLVVFLKDLPWGILIEKNEDDGIRHIMLRKYRHWPSRFRYLAVCEPATPTSK